MSTSSFSHFGQPCLVMLIIHLKSHLCKKGLVCYDYNQFCPLSNVNKNMIKLSKKNSVKTHTYNSVMSSSHRFAKE
jgi:hypothetical protein